MRHAFKLFLLTLCLSAAQPVIRISAQENSSPAVNQAMGSLVARLKGARAVRFPRGSTTMRLSSVRAEGCVLRYELTMESEQPGRPASIDSPQDAVGTIYRTVDEWRVDLADLDSARVTARNPARIKGGAWVYFTTTDGKESVSRTWQQRSRFGAWVRTQQLRIGYFPLRNEGGLEEVAEALRRAVTVCKNPSK